MKPVKEIAVKRTERWIIFTFIGLAAALIMSLMVLRSAVNESFPIPVKAYYAQAKQIEPGMSIDEVRLLLKGVTRESVREDSIHFTMEPTRMSGLAVSQHINVYLDANKRVTHVSTNDG